MKSNVKKLGRNEACYCGSGEKYKRCCLSVNTTEHQISRPNENITQQRSIERLKNRIRKNMGDGASVFQQGDSNDIKMSEVIVDLADFLLERACDEKKQRAAISITCLAWNMAILGMEKGRKFLDAYFDRVDDPIHVKDTMDIVSAIIQRKQAYYPQINRIIMDFEIIRIKNRLHVNVVSIQPEEPNYPINNSTQPVESVVEISA